MNASYKPSIASEVHARHKRPHRLALLATSPVATGEAKQEEPRKRTETMGGLHRGFSPRFISKPYPRKGTKPTHRANRPNEKSSHISGCSFRIALINAFFLFPRISSKRWHEASFFDWSYTLTPNFPFVSGIL